MGINDFVSAQNARLVDMPLFEQHDDTSVAITSDTPSPATPIPPTVPSHQSDASDSGDAGVTTLTALADDLEYTLTVAQTLERFVRAGRKAPSGRSIQRYCDERQLASKKIRTSFGSEWLINESSLVRLIEAEPIVTGDASVAITSDTPSPATPIPPTVPSHQSDASDSGDAGVASRASMSPPIGERRTIAEVLIENAKLLAQVEGRDAIIEELKEDRSFLREEVREGRKTRDDVKNIAERMLDTLKTMAVGRLSMPTQPSQEPMHTTVIDPDNRQG